MIRARDPIWVWLSITLAACECGTSHEGTDAGADARMDSATDDRDATAPGDAAAVDAAADAARDARVIDPDSGVVRGCTSPACDLIDNGCDRNNACYYLPATANGVPQPRCVAAGDNAEGTICTTQEQCAPGLGCDPVNRCRHYCCAPGSSEGCPDGQACLVEYRDNADQSLEVGLCQNCSECDPVASTGCASGQACYPATIDGACRLCLAPRQNGNAGALCTTHSDCRAGFGCRGTTPARCGRFCDVSAPDCGANETCVAIGYTGAPDLGFCQAP